MDRKRPFDVCIVCAKAEEAQEIVEALALLSGERPKQNTLANDSSYKYEYDYAYLKNKSEETLFVFVTSLSQQGPVETAAFVTFLLKEYYPQFIGMTGFCAGDKEVLHLGDLVVAEAAYHYEKGQVKPDENGSMQRSPLIHPYGPAENIIQYIDRFTVSGSWKRSVTQVPYPTSVNPPSIKSLVGYMASGMAVRKDNPFAELRSHNHKTLALDMEAASFYKAVSSFPGIDALVVKGVVDHATLNKNDEYHCYAARVSAIYLLEFIRHYVRKKADGGTFENKNSYNKDNTATRQASRYDFINEKDHSQESYYQKTESGILEDDSDGKEKDDEDPGSPNPRRPMGTLLNTLRYYAGKVYSLAWSPDGKYLAASGTDRTVYVRDYLKRQDIQLLHKHVRSIYTLSWSPDSSQLASGLQSSNQTGNTVYLKRDTDLCNISGYSYSHTYPIVIANCYTSPPEHSYRTRYRWHNF